MLNNVVLIGFMGSGKSTIARKLSQISGGILLDTDLLIQSNFNMKIKYIFEKFGEKEFRSYEKIVVEWIKNSVNNTIIATGGGMPIHCDIDEMGKVVYLDTPFEILQKRVARDKTRPLSDSRLEELFNMREPIYRSKAHLVISTTSNPDDDANKIYELLKGQFKCMRF